MNVDRRDVLISRVVDRDESPEDWRELDRVASDDGGLWDELRYALREDAVVRAGMRSTWEVADRSAPQAKPRRYALRGVSGWLAAAVMAAGWMVSAPWGREPAQPTPAVVSDATVTSASSEDGLAVGEARVVREMPRLVVDTRPTPDRRGVEVLYVRRVLERTVVNEVYELGADEYGTPVPRPVDPAALEVPTSY